jgi:hypothetical protein
MLYIIFYFKLRNFVISHFGVRNIDFGHFLGKIKTHFL